MEDNLNKTMDLFKDMMKDERAAETLKMLVNFLNTKKETESDLQKSNDIREESHDETYSSSVKEINHDTIIKIKKIYDQISHTEDPLVNLLKALKPYLSPKRLSRVDSAIKVVHLSKLSAIINEFDL